MIDHVQVLFSLYAGLLPNGYVINKLNEIRLFYK